MISFLKSFGEVIVSSNLRETKGYSPGFFFVVRKKVLRKVNDFKVLEKRNVHLNGASNLWSKRLPTPKVNKLQSSKLRLTQSLLVATLTQNFMRFRCTVMEISSNLFHQKASYTKSKQATEPQT